MTRRDAFTNTAADAARYEQGHAYASDDRDHDTGEVSELGHDCESYNAHCLYCCLAAGVAAQREAS